MPTAPGNCDGILWKSGKACDIIGQTAHMSHPAPQEEKQHHFLFHIFRMDQAENPMPPKRAESLFNYLMHVLHQ